MKELLQQIAAFLWHVIDAPDTAPETRETAQVLVEDIVDAINDIPAYDDPDRSPQD